MLCARVVIDHSPNRNNAPELNPGRSGGDSPTTSHRGEVGPAIICVMKTIGMRARSAYSYMDLVLSWCSSRHAGPAGACSTIGTHKENGHELEDGYARSERHYHHRP